jgi:hypothetical protein
MHTFTFSDSAGRTYTAKAATQEAAELYIRAETGVKGWLFLRSTRLGKRKGA